jgi:hypothetical protein
MDGDPPLVVIFTVARVYLRGKSNLFSLATPVYWGVTYVWNLQPQEDPEVR